MVGLAFWLRTNLNKLSFSFLSGKKVWNLLFIKIALLMRVVTH